MPTSVEPVITTAAPTSSAARTLIASSTVWSGRTATTLPRFASRSSLTFFIDSSFALHVRIVGPTPAFGHHPLDILRRILDVARLAVHAVLRIDLQALRAVFLDELVDARGAVARFGAGIDRQVERGGDRGIDEPQVRGLV